MTWHATTVTLFPDMLPGPLAHSLAGRALRDGVWRCDTVDLRAHGDGRHRNVDDTPAGGGFGMVLRPDVVDAAVGAAVALGDPARPVLCLTPRGALLDQALVASLAAGPGVVLLCGRYEGIDQRAIEARGMTEISVGDYVLSGGEPAAIVLLDACVRLLPGVMGAAESGLDESHGGVGLLEYPHYTRPAVWQGRGIPDVLLSGNHAAVAAWRRAAAERATHERRPDLWERYLARPVAL